MNPKYKTGDTVKLLWNNKVGKVLSVNPEQRRYIVSASLDKCETLAYLCREEELTNYPEKQDSSKSKIAQFMQLPKEDQRRILSEQAKASVAYYAEDQELKEFRGFI